ncbi:MAG: DUF4190 domain-containing protein [Candidatus Hydrogenedentes bacterium]|nr:DUF4190 domain-containing protein [Candidatus Hydrogenedentota bacterium]
MSTVRCPKCDRELDGWQGAECPQCGERLAVSNEPSPPPIAPPRPAVRVAQTGPAPDAPNDGMAIASLVLGICSYLCTGPLCSVPGIITGVVSLSRIRKSRPKLRGEGLAIGGIVLSGVNLALCVVMIPMMAAIMLPALARAREAARRASCQNNLKQLGLVVKMFANESDGEYYPVLSPESGKLMFANMSAVSKSPVYPEFFTDASILICPSDPSADTEAAAAAQDPETILDDTCYYYLGYVVRSDDEVEEFAEQYRKVTGESGDFEHNLQLSESSLESRARYIYRLREGVEQEFMGDIRVPATAAADIPVLIERIGHHVPMGANVLYMDGHVEFIRYPGKWPMTERTVSVLQALDGGFWPPREVDLGYN